jgi:hypothetical protein
MKREGETAAPRVSHAKRYGIAHLASCDATSWRNASIEAEIHGLCESAALVHRTLAVCKHDDRHPAIYI